MEFIIDKDNHEFTIDEYVESFDLKFMSLDEYYIIPIKMEWMYSKETYHIETTSGYNEETGVDFPAIVSIQKTMDETKEVLHFTCTTPDNVTVAYSVNFTIPPENKN